MNLHFVRQQKSVDCQAIARNAYNGILNPMDLNPSVFESKNQSFFKYLDSK